MDLCYLEGALEIATGRKKQCFLVKKKKKNAYIIEKQYLLKKDGKIHKIKIQGILSFLLRPESSELMLFCKDQPT